MVLLGISALALSGALPIRDALGGYADPIVWLVLAAFFISRAMIKTGLGRRIAFQFIRAIGHHSLGLGYALVSTDFVLASIIPSTGARSGGVVFPIAKSLSEAYESRPGETANRLGAFSDGAALSMRRDYLRHFPYRPGFKRFDCEVCPASDRH